MTKQELQQQCTWNSYGEGNCQLHVPLFDKKIDFTFFAENTKTPKISENMNQTTLDVLKLDSEKLEKVKTLLWEECNFAFTVADYGCVPKESETHLEAHLREFEIASSQDAYAKSTIQEIQIHFENDKLTGRYAEICINSASDNLISIIVKNGKIIDFDDNGTYIPSFEKDEQNAHKSRQNVLNS